MKGSSKLLARLSELGLVRAGARRVLGDVHGQEAWKPLMGAVFSQFEEAWMPLMSDRFAQFEYEDEQGFAIIWHVAGIDSRVIIDPRVSFGAPTISGIPTWAIKGRYDAGESLDDIQENFGLTQEHVIEALRFEGIERPSNGHTVL